MKKKYDLSLFIFRRDLRLVDNTALYAAYASSKQILPCFIFDNRQIKNNAYKSNFAIQFMVNSLVELDNELKKFKGKLYFFNGISETIIKKIIMNYKIDAVFINRDYTPFSQMRDHNIKVLCERLQVDYQCYADALLHEPEEVLKADNAPYQMFTPFYKKAVEKKVNLPHVRHFANFYHQEIVFCTDHFIRTNKKNVSNMLLKGGRKEGKKCLQQVKKLQDYKIHRDFPALHATTTLSAHLKFGTVSIREVYAEIIKQFGKSHTLIKELYWRDFFSHIVFNCPDTFGNNFQKKYDNIKWQFNKSHWLAWCHGLTGFPIVDAGMRQLNTTGFMHNRVRMIVASFLTKDLHIDWRLGEKYFATKLLDYDPAINNGNWQWVAGTGCDALPYFRIFNPWTQQKKYDAHCYYIKQWVKELAIIDPKIIHSCYQHAIEGYPKPIVNHDIESKQAKLMYRDK